MSVSTSPLSYTDCYEVMATAIEDKRGVRVRMDSLGDATHFRMRCHQARTLDRRENSKTYASDHPLHGRSAYDVLVLTLEEDEDSAWVYFSKVILDTSRVESLSDEPEQIEHEPVKQLASPTAIRRV